MRKSTFLKAFVFVIGAAYASGAFAAKVTTNKATGVAVTTQISGVSAITQVTPTESAVLKHSYTFDDGTANDVIGAVNGTLNGTASVANGSLVLDANGDYVTFDGVALALNNFTAITMEYYYTGSAAANTGWNWTGYFGNDAGADAFYTTLGHWNNEIRSTYNAQEILKRGLDVNNGKLHQLVAVLTAEENILYKDGVLLGKVANTKGISIGTAFAILGRGPTAWNDPTWQGTIDEFNIYEGAMDSTAIALRAESKLNASNSYLISIVPSVGQVAPELATTQMEYSISVPAGTTSLNVAVAPRVAEAVVTMLSGVGFDQASGTVTTNLDVALVDGVGVVYVQVQSADQTSISNYVIYVSTASDCFTPLMETGNLIVDPQITGLSTFAGWGVKSITVNPDEVYCGGTSVKIGDGLATCKGSIDFGLNGIIEPSSIYRVRAMVKSVDGSAQLGVFGWKNGAGDINSIFDSGNEWKQLDFTFTSGEAVGSNAGLFINNCGGRTAKTILADNWEMYKVDVANSVSVKYVNKFGKEIREAVTTSTYANIGDVVKATAADKLDFQLDGVSYTLDTTSVDSVVLASGANVITLKYNYDLNGSAMLMHSYTFEDGTAADQAGSLDGQVKGAAKVENGALVTSADGDYMALDGAALDLAKYSSITTEVFVKSKGNAGWSMLTYFGGANSDGAWFTSIARNDNVSRVDYQNGGGVNGPELEDGKMHHVVSTLTDSTIALWIDGILIGEGVNVRPIAQIKNTYAYLCESGWPDPTYNGMIYEFNIYEGKLSADSIAAHADVFLTPTSSALKDVQLSVGSIAPMFSPIVNSYSAKVPAGTTTVNVSAAPKSSEAIVSVISGYVDFTQATAVSTTNVDVELVNGRGVATIQVIASDLSSNTLYYVYIAEDANCFTPLMETGNLVDDSEVNSLATFAGWGTKSITYNADEVYCGASAASVGNGTATCTGSIDVRLVDKIEESSSYRVRAMAKTTDGSFQIGVWGFAAGQADLNNVFNTNGEWKLLDFTFTSSDSLKVNDHGMFVNNCGTSTGKKAFVDNWEMYKVDAPNAVTVKYVDAMGAALKDAVVTNNTSLLGTIVKAAAGDKADIMVADVKYIYDETSVDSVALAQGANEITLKFKSTVGVVNPMQLSSKVYVVNQTLNVDVAMTSAASIQVDVIDLQGKIVEARTANVIAGMNKLTFELPSQGVYMVRLNTGDNTSVHKVVR